MRKTSGGLSSTGLRVMVVELTEDKGARGIVRWRDGLFTTNISHPFANPAGLIKRNALR